MNICVFCGSSRGVNPVYAETVRRLGALMAKDRHSLIYGGGKVGLMGIVADSVMESGGDVIGVIPEFLQKREVGHHGITRLEVVQSMHQRKQRMADLADAFVALPGGMGTLEELCEILTWKQLGLISQPVGVLNINHFFDPLLTQLRLMVGEGYLKDENLNLIKVHASPEILLSSLKEQV